MRSITSSLTFVAIAVAACAAPSAGGNSDQDRPVEPKVAPASVPERVPQPEAAPAVTGEVPQELISRMRADLAERIGKEAAGAARVVRAEAVQWPDGSLGCGKPGQFYTQAVVPGYRVELEAGGKVYSYHASAKGYFKLCELPTRRN